jgi:hypothetical protein
MEAMCRLLFPLFGGEIGEAHGTNPACDDTQRQPLKKNHNDSVHCKMGLPDDSQPNVAFIS